MSGRSKSIGDNRNKYGIQGKEIEGDDDDDDDDDDGRDCSSLFVAESGGWVREVCLRVCSISFFNFIFSSLYTYMVIFSFLRSCLQYLY